MEKKPEDDKHADTISPTKQKSAGRRGTIRKWRENKNQIAFFSEKYSKYWN